MGTTGGKRSVGNVKGSIASMLLAALGFLGAGEALAAAPVMGTVSKPVSNSTYIPGEGIAFQGNASDADYNLANIKFYANKVGSEPVLLATQSCGGSFCSFNTYSYTAPEGTSSVDIVVTDATGLQATRNIPLSVAAANNRPPNVPTLNSPASGAKFVPGQSINFNVTISDVDGLIQRFEIYNNNNVLVASYNCGGSSASCTTGAISNSVPDGTTGWYAKAYDTMGASTISATRPISVSLANNLPPSTPTQSLPASGAKFVPGQQIVFQASASDPDGYIQKLEVYSNTNDLLGSYNCGGGSASCNNVYIYSTTAPAGTTSWYVKAYDTLGGTSVSANRPISVDMANIQPPTEVTFNYPAANASYNPSQSVSVGVSANDPDGYIAKIELFNTQNQKLYTFSTCGTTMGSTCNSSFPVTLPEGTTGLYAVATDSHGLSRTSATRNVTSTWGNPAISVGAMGWPTQWALGTTYNLTASYSGSSSATYGYEWRVNGASVGGGTKTSFAFTPTADMIDGAGKIKVEYAAWDTAAAVAKSSGTAKLAGQYLSASLPKAQPVVTISGSPSSLVLGTTYNYVGSFANTTYPSDQRANLIGEWFVNGVPTKTESLATSTGSLSLSVTPEILSAGKVNVTFKVRLSTVPATDATTETVALSTPAVWPTLQPVFGASNPTSMQLGQPAEFSATRDVNYPEVLLGMVDAAWSVNGNAVGTGYSYTYTPTLGDVKPNGKVTLSFSVHNPAIGAPAPEVVSVDVPVVLPTLSPVISSPSMSAVYGSSVTLNASISNTFPTNLLPGRTAVWKTVVGAVETEVGTGDTVTYEPQPTDVGANGKIMLKYVTTASGLSDSATIELTPAFPALNPMFVMAPSQMIAGLPSSFRVTVGEDYPMFLRSFVQRTWTVNGRSISEENGSTVDFTPQVEDIRSGKVTVVFSAINTYPGAPAGESASVEIPTVIPTLAATITPPTTPVQIGSEITLTGGISEAFPQELRTGMDSRWFIDAASGTMDMGVGNSLTVTLAPEHLGSNGKVNVRYGVAASRFSDTASLQLTPSWPAHTPAFSSASMPSSLVIGQSYSVGADLSGVPPQLATLVENKWLVGTREVAIGNGADFIVQPGDLNNAGKVAVTLEQRLVAPGAPDAKSVTVELPAVWPALTPVLSLPDRMAIGQSYDLVSTLNPAYPASLRDSVSGQWYIGGRAVALPYKAVVADLNTAGKFAVEYRVSNTQQGVVEKAAMEVAASLPNGSSTPVTVSSEVVLGQPITLDGTQVSRMGEIGTGLVTGQWSINGVKRGTGSSVVYEPLPADISSNGTILATFTEAVSFDSANPLVTNVVMTPVWPAITPEVVPPAYVVPGLAAPFSLKVQSYPASLRSGLRAAWFVGDRLVGNGLVASIAVAESEFNTNGIAPVRVELWNEARGDALRESIPVPVAMGGIVAKPFFTLNTGAVLPKIAMVGAVYQLKANPGKYPTNLMSGVQYQWRLNGEIVASGDSLTWTPSEASTGTKIELVMSNSMLAGAPATVAWTVPVVMPTLTPALVSAPKFILYNTPYTFAAGFVGMPQSMLSNIAYDWQVAGSTRATDGNMVYTASKADMVRDARTGLDMVPVTLRAWWKNKPEEVKTLTIAVPATTYAWTNRGFYLKLSSPAAYVGEQGAKVTASIEPGDPKWTWADSEHVSYGIDAQDGMTVTRLSSRTFELTFAGAGAYTISATVTDNRNNRAMLKGSFAALSDTGVAVTMDYATNKYQKAPADVYFSPKVAGLAKGDFVTKFEVQVTDPNGVLVPVKQVRNIFVTRLPQAGNYKSVLLATTKFGRVYRSPETLIALRSNEAPTCTVDVTASGETTDRKGFYRVVVPSCSDSDGFLKGLLVTVDGVPTRLSGGKVIVYDKYQLTGESNLPSHTVKVTAIDDNGASVTTEKTVE